MAEDLASETFVVALRARDRFRDGGAGYVPWLLRIATNLLRRTRRDEDRYLRAVAGTKISERDSGGFLAADARRSTVDALLGLSADERDPLLLHALAGLSYADCSAALGAPAGTVASRINRARTRVRLTPEEEPERGRA